MAGPRGSPTPAAAPDPPRPTLDRLLRAAEVLAGDLPYVRVDLYRERGEIWFGEPKVSPKGGHVPLPYWFDMEMGSGPAEPPFSAVACLDADPAPARP